MEVLKRKLFVYFFDCQLYRPVGSSSSSDDGDCDAPGASRAADQATTFAHRILSPVQGVSSGESNVENSLKLDCMK